MRCDVEAQSTCGIRYRRCSSAAGPVRPGSPWTRFTRVQCPRASSLRSTPGHGSPCRTHPLQSCRARILNAGSGYSTLMGRRKSFRGRYLMDGMRRFRPPRAKPDRGLQAYSVASIVDALAWQRAEASRRRRAVAGRKTLICDHPAAHGDDQTLTSRWRRSSRPPGASQ